MWHVNEQNVVSPLTGQVELFTWCTGCFYGPDFSGLLASRRPASKATIRYANEGTSARFSLRFALSSHSASLSTFTRWATSVDRNGQPERNKDRNLIHSGRTCPDLPCERSTLFRESRLTLRFAQYLENKLRSTKGRNSVSNLSMSSLRSTATWTGSLRGFQLCRDWTWDKRSPVFLSPLRRMMSPIVCPTRRESRDRVSFMSILSSRWTGRKAVPSVSVTSEIPDGVTQFPLFTLVCQKFYGHFSSNALCVRYLRNYVDAGCHLRRSNGTVLRSGDTKIAVPLWQSVRIIVKTMRQSSLRCVELDERETLWK